MFEVYLNDKRDLLVVEKGVRVPLSLTESECRGLCREESYI